MKIEDLVVLFTYLLAISTANERLITLIKTMVPWFSEEAVDFASPASASQFRWKSFAVQCMTIVSAFFTSYIITNQGLLKDGVWKGLEANFWIVGILASGGSAFWSGLLGYTTALKEIKKVELTEKKVKLAKMVKKLQTKATIFHEQ